MTARWSSVILCSSLLVCARAHAERCSPDGSRTVSLSGTVVDPSDAAVEGAIVSLSGSPAEKSVTDARGAFSFHCVNASSYKLHVEAKGFAQAEIKGRGNATVTVRLDIADLKQVVDVGEDTGATLDQDHGAGTQILTSKDIRAMADDPDDFKRQLQVLAASSGGAPGQAIVTVDGFMNDSKLPPKGSIASIRVNPDLYSAEYVKPPYQGGRIEIFTKPGGAPQGAVFFSESPSLFNANDPFTQNGAPGSKRRYGFELSGPIKPQKSDYFVAFEKRDIDEFNIVNAVVLDPLGIASPMHQSVSAPRQLWIGSVRSDWQLGPKHTLVAAYSGNVSDLSNEGVGGLVLQEAGYDALISEHSLRISDIGVLGPNLLNQTRFGITWKGIEDTPASTAPSLNVAGAFVGGGATVGRLRDRERDFEFDDDLSFTHKSHSLKFGVTALGFFERNYTPDTFNGSFLFGGGYSGSGQAPISPLEQYRLALLSLPGGVPTRYDLTTGTPAINFSQWQVALYAQDQWKVKPGFSISLGLRYAMQTSPGSLANVAPRIGLAWSPDKKQKWVLRFRAGLFYDPIDQSVAALAYRLNGRNQTQVQLYAPSYAQPLTPTADTVSVQTYRQLGRGLGQSTSFQPQIGVERQLPQHWHVQANLSYAMGWNLLRSRNINAPVVTADTVNPLLAPRPLAPGENILQFDQSGSLRGPVLFVGADQHSYKHFGVFVGYLYFNLRTDADSPTLLPQSSYSNQGEMARASWEPGHQLFAVGQVELPRKVSFTSQFTFASGTPYNPVTGMDNNGDGALNDRPSIVSQPGPGVYQTPFGLLSTTGVNGTLGRNVGTMPGLIHLDGNLSRTFQIRAHGLSSDQHQTVTLNARVANVLNHTNVTSVGNVVGSPTFAQALAAETARRFEIGVRYTF